jgi:nitroimidazol reductase NimA-like FMN-containing flavoprotein (pyridoxamine 5'-phosphate oxidase superfamily)
MKRETRRLVLNLLARGETMTIATVRPDGFPQATTVAYASDGLTLWFACDRECQKVQNLARSPKVSLTVNGEGRDWGRVQGLSMGALAEVASGADARHGLALLGKRFPPMAGLSAEERNATAVVKVTPVAISVIDYTKGFGHTELYALRSAPRRRRGGALREESRPGA